MRARFFVAVPLVVLAAWPALPAEAQRTLTETEVVELALARSPIDELTAADAELERALGLVDGAWVNPELGYTREEAYGRNPSVLKSGRHDAAFYGALWAAISRGEIWSGRLCNRRKDGTCFDEDASITPVRGADGRITHYIAVKRDISAVRSLEEQLLHAQKMEAIGRLAGGIAHDFNNILTTINGYSEMLADAAPPDSPLAADLAEILGAGRRAAMLTRQLLLFSRRAPADPVTLDLRVPVRTLEKMLRRTVGEDIRLDIRLSAEPLWVTGDAGQLDQVIMNLAVNARDAMPGGGVLTLSAREETLVAGLVDDLEVVPAGAYVALTIADDGAGMTPEVKARIFEPFFTTKEKGKGTGLGLATVFGIVKQNGGHIRVDSAPGKGAAFTVYLPRADAPPSSSEVGPDMDASPARGDETVLVVEDQADLLRLVTRTLTAQGYRVRAFGSASTALEVVKTQTEPLHLLLTDVVMPKMSGIELAKKVLAHHPEAQILYMSGYTDGRLDELASGSAAPLLLKPFSPAVLCRRVRAALDAAAPSRPS